MPLRGTNPLLLDSNGQTSLGAKTVSVFSVHNPPKQGFSSRMETAKAYSTLFGGFLYMCVSTVHSLSAILSHKLISVKPCLVLGMSICGGHDCPLPRILLRCQ